MLLEQRHIKYRFSDKIKETQNQNQIKVLAYCLLMAVLNENMKMVISYVKDI